MNNRIHLPIKSFERFEETLENSNFHPVKIMICHTGQNLNGSVFSIDSFNKSVNTLSNIPILGFVEVDENGNKDFAGHEIELDLFVDDDGKVKVKEYYKEVPIGVIPETNEYFFEEIDGETYLGCYGYIWKCYSNDAYDILLEDEQKEVSMEILVKECSYDKKNRCNIDKFEFLGVTVLGSAHPGAMSPNAVIDMNFSTDGNKEFFDAVEKLNEILKSQRKEEFVMDIEEKNLPIDDENIEKVEFENENNDDLEQPIENFENNEEDEVCPECGKNPCECEDEKFAEEDKDDNKEDEVCPECGKNPCECEDEKEDFEVEDEEVRKEEFGLSYNNLYRAVRICLDKETYQYTSFWGDTFECQKYYLFELIPTDNIAVVYDDEDGNFYGISYSVDNDDAICNLENKVQYIQEWRPKVDGAEVFEVEDKDKVSVALLYERVGEELHSLRQYKQNIEETEKFEQLKQQVEEILSTFSFDEEEISELKEKALNKEIDLEKFEDKLCVLEVKKMRNQKFSSKQSEEINSLPISDTEGKNKTVTLGKYQDLLNKYGNKK